MDTRGSASIEYLAIATLVAMGGLVAWAGYGDGAAGAIDGGAMAHGRGHDMVASAEAAETSTALGSAQAEVEEAGLVVAIVRFATVPLRASIARIRQATAESQNAGKGAFGHALLNAVTAPAAVAVDATYRIRGFLVKAASAVAFTVGMTTAPATKRDAPAPSTTTAGRR